MSARDEELPVLTSINGPIKSILKELLSTAKRRKSGSYTVLYEAYSSLKACPIQFRSIRQLLSLSGFGPALVDKIEMQLCEWCLENNKRYIETQSSSSAARQNAIDIDEDGEEDQETDSDLDRQVPSKRAKEKSKQVPIKSSTKKKAVEKEPKIFVPQHRTGTHGILVSLFTLTPNMPDEDVAGGSEPDAGMHYHSKASVIQFAQPYSNSSYIPKETSAPGSGYGNYHCAWSGMKTLINRAYIYRRGNPARFGLSRQGWKVAQICAEREKGLSAGCNESKLGEVDTIPEPSKKKKKSSKEVAVEQSSSKEFGPFLYTYLDGGDPPQQTRHRKDASIRLSDRDYRMMFKIVFSRDLAEHAFTKSCIENIAEEGSLMCGWVREAVCNEVAPGLTLRPTGTLGPTPEAFSCTTKESMKQPLPKPSASQQSTIDAPMNVLQKHINNSQGTVIELLTSSDVEFEALPRPIPVKVKAKPVRRRQDSSSESDLSDMAPIVKQKKAAKVKA